MMHTSDEATQRIRGYQQYTVECALTLMGGMFSFEILQILQVFLIFGRLLVLGQVLIVLVLGCLCLSLVRLLLSLAQALPVFTDKFCNLRERQILALEILSHLCKTRKRYQSHKPYQDRFTQSKYIGGRERVKVEGGQGSREGTTRDEMTKTGWEGAYYSRTKRMQMAAVLAHFRPTNKVSAKVSQVILQCNITNQVE